MTHKAIFDIFNTRSISEPRKTIKEWFPNGRGSIRIIFEDKSEIIFTWKGDDEWSIESVKNYLNKFKL